MRLRSATSWHGERRRGDPVTGDVVTPVDLDDL
jgi:hypothetical protein